MSIKASWILKDANFDKKKMSAKDISCRRVIGTGLMGTVRLARLGGDTGPFFALKVRQV